MPAALRVLPGYRPHDAVILGIDPAIRSGWSLFVRGKLVHSGVAKTGKDRFVALETAVTIAAEEELPLVIVAETWSTGDWKSWAAIASVHEAWGRWAEQCELANIKNIVRVLVNEWRGALYGKSVVVRMPRKIAKAMAKQRVKSIYKMDVSDDEAEGILIGEWGCRAAPVSALITA